VSSILHVFLRIGFLNWTVLQETDANIFQRTSRRGHHAFPSEDSKKRVSTFIESASEQLFKRHIIEVYPD